MRKTRVAVDRENEFKSFCYEHEDIINSFLGEMNNKSFEEIKNIISIYKSKTWEFVEYFEEHGLLYFDDSCYLRLFVSSYLYYYLDKWLKKCLEYGEYLSNTTCFPLIGFQLLFFNRNRDKEVVNSINQCFEDISSIEVNDLPSFFQDTIFDKTLYQSFLPDCYSIFIDECLRELAMLGFDLEKELDLKSIDKKRAEMEEESREAIDRDGLSEGQRIFNDFVEANKLDIKSSYYTFKI